MTDPLGNVSTYAYDAVGNLVSVADGNGKVTTNTYASDSNRLVSVTDPNGLTTGYAYDLAGQQTAVIDPAGGRVTTSYTAEGWRRSLENQLGHKTTWSYDKAGRPVTVMNARGQVKTLAYDAVNRLVSVAYADGTVATMAYDPSGRRTTLSDWTGVTTYVFGGRGECTDETQVGLRIQRAYDAVGNRTTLVDPDGGVFTYVFDALDRVSVARGPTGAVFTHSYDAAGRLTTIVTASRKRRWQYDAAGRVTTLTEQNSLGAFVFTQVDTWDAAGNKTKTVKDGAVTTYTMDAGYRLTGQELAGARATFAYDTRGNLTVKHNQGSDPVTLTFDAASRVTTIQDGPTRVTQTYDATGNLTAEDRGGVVTQWQYDPEDRMTVEVRPDATRASSTYGFDGLRRTVQEPGAAVRTMVWDGSDYLKEYP